MSSEESYNRRLEYAIDWASRDPHGQFLLQHFLRLSGLLTAVNNERRSVAVEFLSEMAACRNGNAIVRTALNNLVSIEEEENASTDYDAVESAFLES